MSYFSHMDNIFKVEEAQPHIWTFRGEEAMYSHFSHGSTSKTRCMAIPLILLMNALEQALKCLSCLQGTSRVANASQAFGTFKEFFDAIEDPSSPPLTADQVLEANFSKFVGGQDQTA